MAESKDYPQRFDFRIGPVRAGGAAQAVRIAVEDEVAPPAMSLKPR